MSDKPAVHLRFRDTDQHKALSDEAKADGRSLNNYLLHLIETNPNRKRQKAKGKK